MGFNKEIRSKKDVTINYWRLKSFSFSEGGFLTMRVAGYKSSGSYASGAEAIDEYECIISNADLSLKTKFYDILEQLFPLFKGAEKDITASGETSGPQTLTVQTPRGDLIMREVINVPEKTPDENAPPCIEEDNFAQPDIEENVAKEELETASILINPPKRKKRGDSSPDIV